jgi:hypothetical protein
MKTQAAMIVATSAVLLSGCATSKQTHLPDGRLGCFFGGRGRTRTGTPVSQKQILSLLCLPFHHAATR